MPVVLSPSRLKTIAGKYSTLAVQGDGETAFVTFGEGAGDFDTLLADEITWAIWGKNAVTPYLHKGQYPSECWESRSYGHPHLDLRQARYYFKLADGTQELHYGPMYGPGEGFRDGGWHLFTFSRSKSSLLARHWLDDALVDSDVVAAKSLLPNAVDVKATILSGFPVDEISIWKRQLTTEEVGEIYNAGVPCNLSGHSRYADLVAWWRFEGDLTDEGGPAASSGPHNGSLESGSIEYISDTPG